MNDLGIAIGLTEHGYNPRELDYIKAANEVWDKDGGPAGRLLLKYAHDVLVATGRGRGAPAFHLHFLTKSAAWDYHAKEMAAHVANVLEVLEPMRKQAMMVAHPFGVPALVETAGMLGRAGVMGAMGLGGGAGALYWLLSRHANQDTADMEAMKNQTDYYHQLSRELDDSMRRKYRYERHQQPQQPAQSAQDGGTDPSAFAA